MAPEERCDLCDTGVMCLGSTVNGVHEDGKGVAMEGVGVVPIAGPTDEGLATAGVWSAAKVACFFSA